MPDERAETLAREAQVYKTNTPPVEIGGKPQVAAAVTEQAAPPADEQTSSETGETTPMIPKFRYDELNQKYQTIKNQPKQETIPDLDKLVEAKLAPFKVQMETDRVMKTYEDFPSFADVA